MATKMWVTLAACGIAGAIALGCSGMGGISEGDPCGGTQDNCGSNLTCQPIKGHNGNYCCPTPASASKEDNCHATQ
jgi:hypothetical protein